MSNSSYFEIKRSLGAASASILSIANLLFILHYPSLFSVSNQFFLRFLLSFFEITKGANKYIIYFIMSLLLFYFLYKFSINQIFLLSFSVLLYLFLVKFYYLSQSKLIRVNLALFYISVSLFIIHT